MEAPHSVKLQDLLCPCIRQMTYCRFFMPYTIANFNLELDGGNDWLFSVIGFYKPGFNKDSFKSKRNKRTRLLKVEDRKSPIIGECSIYKYSGTTNYRRFCILHFLRSGTRLFREFVWNNQYEWLVNE